jgi:hypothetical protein
MSDPVSQNHDVDDDPAPDVIARARAILAEIGQNATCTGFDTMGCPCRDLALRLARMEQMKTHSFAVGQK